MKLIIAEVLFLDFKNEIINPILSYSNAPSYDCTCQTSKLLNKSTKLKIEINKIENINFKTVVFSPSLTPILTAAIPPTRRETPISKTENPKQAGAGNANGRQQNQWWFVSLDHVTPSPLNHDN